jgi:hypothetical protein
MSLDRTADRRTTGERRFRSLADDQTREIAIAAGFGPACLVPNIAVQSG